jgi:hypothetical protein
MNIRVARLANSAIIGPELRPSIGANARGMTISRDVLSEIRTPHVAAPDVHVRCGTPMDRDVFPQPGRGPHQVSRVAIAQNGIDFTAWPDVNS